MKNTTNLFLPILRINLLKNVISIWVLEGVVLEGIFNHIYLWASGWNPMVVNP